MSGGSALSGFSMFELFKVEAETNCAVLSDGLLAVESNPNDLAQIEPLMRAAHSMKGAARIIGLDLVVQLAHAMEDCLVAAQKGQERLGSERVDQLLQGVDTIGQLAALAEADVPEWTEKNTERVDGLIASINAPAPATSASPSVRSPAEAPVAPPDPPRSPPESANEDVAAPPDPAAQEPVAKAVTPDGAASSEGARGPAPETSFVRVGAEHLNRLVQLAGESVVESRRIQSFRQSMLQLRDGQRRLGAALEAAHAHRGDPVDRFATVHDEALRAQEQIRRHADALEDSLRRSELLSNSLYHEVLSSRMRPFSEGTAGFPRMVRDLARELGKKVSFEIIGESVPVDRDVLSKLEAPLNHMIRNCIDHGLETPDVRSASGKPEIGSITLEARHHAGMLTVLLRDDGRGIDPEGVRRRAVERGFVEASLAEALGTEEILEFLFLPGFSTASQLTEISGRGVGLDVVQSMVHDVAGSVRVESEPGRSTVFTLRLPITLSVVRAAIVEVSGEPYAFPPMHLGGMLRLEPDEITPVEGRQQFTHEGRSVGLVHATELLDLPAGSTEESTLSVTILGEGEKQCGLIVDRFMGEQDLVVCALDARLGRVPHLSSAAVLENGDPVLIVDCEDLLQSMQQMLQEGRLRRTTSLARETVKEELLRVLVVEDSITVREVERQLLTRHGYEVDVAVDGQDGWNALKTKEYDLLVTDIDMPRMNGFELVRQVRRDPRLMSLPIIIVSYKDRKEDRMRGMEVGANAYLTKHSFHDDSLIRMAGDLTGQADS